MVLIPMAMKAHGPRIKVESHANVDHDQGFKEKSHCNGASGQPIKEEGSAMPPKEESDAKAERGPKHVTAPVARRPRPRWKREALHP